MWTLTYIILAMMYECISDFCLMNLYYWVTQNKWFYNTSDEELVLNSYSPPVCLSLLIPVINLLPLHVLSCHFLTGQHKILSFFHMATKWMGPTQDIQHIFGKLRISAFSWCATYLVLRVLWISKCDKVENSLPHGIFCLSTDVLHRILQKIIPEYWHIYDTEK